MLNESFTEPHPEPQRPAPSNPSPSPEAAPKPPTSGEPDVGAHDVGARTPDEYTEMPGSHRRGSDGAALDVGA